MKRMLTVLTLLALSATGALAQGNSCIGMFTDASVNVCNANTPQYTITSVHFYAMLDVTEIPTTSAVQFKVSNYPAAGLGLVTQTWNTPLVIGEPSTDIALAFTVPLAAPAAYLGKVDFFPLNPAWIGSDYLMEVVPADSQTEILIVRGSDNIEIGVPGGDFVFNGANDCNCPGTAVEDAAWGSIKALY